MLKLYNIHVHLKLPVNGVEYIFHHTFFITKYKVIR